MIYILPRLLPAGDAAILIEWADEIDDAINDRVHAFAAHLRAQNRAEIRDLIPAYASLLVCFDPQQISFAGLSAFLRSVLQSAPTSNAVDARAIEIPVAYGGKFGPDLEFVAQYAGVTQDEIVRLHTGIVYRVYLIGFAPGFAYLGSVPESIAAPRLETPRTRVPAGSIVIAGRQTGIYPMETPGGWRIIGRTALQMFDPHRDPPALLRPGDRVRFISVT
ncbi:5-oxoprolinase subunit B [Anaerolineae bacterium]|nr:5-oxoprolinase subunit B [Anaerolineae bacterium]